MQLFRFTALDTQRAMNKINDVLGSEALIYSTRKIPYGIEILAGVANNKHDDGADNNIQLQSGESNQELIDKLNIQLQHFDESIKCLTLQIEVMRQQAENNMYRRFMAKLKKIISFKKPIKEGVYGQPIR